MFFSPLNVTVTLRWDASQFAAFMKFLTNDDPEKALKIAGELRSSQEALTEELAKTKT